MTKEVLISIKGIQFIENDNVGGVKARKGQEPSLRGHSDNVGSALGRSNAEAEVLEVVTTGTYHCRDGNQYIKYDEVFEGIEGKASSLISIKGDIVEVRKTGVLETHMVFDKQKRTTMLYTTPYGTLHMNITTTNLTTSEHQDNIDIQANYTLEANEETLSNNVLEIHITSN